MKRHVLMVVVWAHAGLGASCEVPPAESEPTDPPDQEVQEAVVREMMAGFSNSKGLIHCVQFRIPEPAPSRRRWEDPSPEFLKRFSPGTEVVRGSACGFGDLQDPVQHRPTGRAAVLYTVGMPNWDGEASAEIIGGWSRGSLWGRSCHYDLARERGQWAVKDVRDCIEN